MDFDVLIIGSGPAAVSAALYILRAGFNISLISMGMGALAKAERIENFYGLSKPISGSELHKVGESQVKALGAEIIHGEVVALNFDGKSYSAILANGNSYSAYAVVLATGATRKIITIPGLAELEGHGVSYCAVCDGFFYRGKRICVLGSGEYARHEAEYLLKIAQSVTVLTNGESVEAEMPDGILIDKRKIASILGSNKLEAIKFEGGSEIKADGLFVALGNAGSTSLALTLGALVENNCIVVNENMQSTIPGLFAAGDCTGGMLQVSKAVCDGAKAGISVINYLKKQR